LKKLLVLFSFLASAQLYAQQPPVSYNINATLNDPNRTIDGFIKFTYRNKTDSSLNFLWVNVYPNAFKSDRTAFSEYMLDKGRTDFYFTKEDRRGYINRLDFRSGDNILKVEDHPQYIEVIKVWLHKPLLPGDSVSITTPFHVKVPYQFDAIGYKGFYLLKYWYPAVASYVKPLTTADSSSNEYGDYRVVFNFNKNLYFAGPYADQAETIIARKSDSLKQVTFTAQNVNDVSVTIYRTDAPEVVQLHGPPDRFWRIKKILSHPILPAVGYNVYDGLQLGLLLHDGNTTFLNRRPEPKSEAGADFSESYMRTFEEGAHSASLLTPSKAFTYYFAPTYAFRSKSFTGIAGVSYKFNIPQISFVNQFQAGLNTSTFSYDDGIDTNAGKVFARVFKATPYITADLKSSNSKIKKSLSFKSYILTERDLTYRQYTVDSLYYPQEDEYSLRFVNQLTFNYSNTRVLYPFNAQLQLQQGIDFYRINAEGTYFFNYPDGGGLTLRAFAAKFGYVGSLSEREKFTTQRFQPKLTAVRGGEDFIYRNYFIGRNEFDGLASRQIMNRDGGLKLRTDLFAGQQGRSDNWIASINTSSTIPDLFPVRLPLRVFFDAGTYAEAWDEDNLDPRFLYVAGLQLTLFKGALNIYAPVFYNKTIRDNFKSVDGESGFFDTVSFSFDPVFLLKRL
jgi:hypothetical protein